MNNQALDWIRGKRILFLAKFAPLVGNINSQEVSDRPYSVAYHFEIYSLLKELPATVISSREPTLLLESSDEFDFVFSLYNKIPCRNGEVLISAICEYKKIPYIGATPNMRCLAEDKHLAKIVASSRGITVPDWVRFPHHSSAVFSGPYFVKPRFGGASQNITPGSVKKNWKSAFDLAQNLRVQGVECIIEKYIPGVNVTLPIQGGKKKRVFSPVFIPSLDPHNLITEKDKFSTSTPHSYSLYKGEKKETIVRYGNLLIDALDAFDYARADFRVSESEVYFLEINIGCDISSASSFYFSASKSGLSQKNIVFNAIEAALERAAYI